MHLPHRIGKTTLTGLVILSLFATSCRYVREEKLPESGATLEGTVMYGGEPIQFALIQIQTANGQAAGKVGEDGRYRVENVPLGEVMIGVNTAAAQGDYQSKMMSGGAYKGPEAKGKGRVTGLKFIQIPSKYFDPGTSGFKTTISAGSNTYDIVIPR
jgi:hypothetical protein